MKRLLTSRPVDHALRGAALVVTDRRWAAPLSAAALGFGIFAGVAIGPGTTGTLATAGRQIVEIPASSEGDGQSGGGGAAASAGSPAPPAEAAGGSFEVAIPSAAPLVAEPAEAAPAPAPEPAGKPAPAAGGEEEEPGEEAQQLKGTVVHANSAAGSYALAIAGGELVSIHAPRLPEPGTKMTVPVRRLANGTFAEAGEVEKGEKTATRVTFRGVVTFADPDPAAPTYTVSGRGSSLLVHVEPDPTGAVPELPTIGSYLTVTAELDDGLWQEKVEGEPGPPSTYLDLAGIVKEVLPDGHLAFSADWAGESESTLTLAVPGEIDAAKLEPGDSYLATAEVVADGTLTLKGIAGDERAKGANDPAGAQGDLAR